MHLPEQRAALERSSPVFLERVEGACELVAEGGYNEPRWKGRVDLGFNGAESVDMDGQQEEVALHFLTHLIQLCRLALHELRDFVGQAGAFRGPGPAGVCAGDVDEGFGEDGVVGEEHGEQEEARRVGGDCGVEGLAVLV